MLVVVCALAAVVVLTAVQPARLPWRYRIFTAKLRGESPSLSWANLAGLMRPVGSWHYRARQDGEPPCPALWQTKLGQFWGRASDGSVLFILTTEQFIDDIYQRAEVRIAPGDIVLDAGANLGAFTRVALDRGARQVIAFEPEPTNCACFKRTFRDELASGRVVLVEAALWDTPGSLEFAPAPENFSGSGTVLLPREKAARSFRVPATTIDDALSTRGERVDFIKMDIEGAEKHALRGGKATIARFVPRMAIAIEHLDDDAEQIPNTVLEITAAYRVTLGDTVAYFVRSGKAPARP